MDSNSSFIHDPRSQTPKPSSNMNMPAKKNDPPASITFTQEELSRRVRGTQVLQRPRGPRVKN